MSKQVCNGQGLLRLVPGLGGRRGSLTWTWLTAVAVLLSLVSIETASAEVGDTRYIENPTPAQLQIDCQAGYSFACVNLGMYYQNRETASGRQRARSLYLEACDMGDERGCHYWRRMQPVVVETDRQYVPITPRAHASNAPAHRVSFCDARHTKACVARGKSLEATGKRANRAQARKLYDQACKWHDRAACGHAKRLSSLAHVTSKPAKSHTKAVTSKPAMPSRTPSKTQHVQPVSKPAAAKAFAIAKPPVVKPSVSPKSSTGATTLKPPLPKPVPAVKPATPAKPTPQVPAPAPKPKPVPAVASKAPAIPAKPVATPAKTPPAPALPSQTPATVALAAACQKGDGNACLSVGQMYSGGVGVARNVNLTLQFYDRSCKLKTAPACLALGTMYEIGTGTKPDLKKAAGYYQMACNNGNAIACQMTSGHPAPASAAPPQKATRR